MMLLDAANYSDIAAVLSSNSSRKADGNTDLQVCVPHSILALNFRDPGSPQHYGAMRLARVSVWKALYARKANQPPSFLLDCVTLFISLVAKSCQELYRTTVRKVHGAPSRCCISTVPAEVSLGRFGGADSIFSKSSRCPGAGRKTETT